MTVFCHLMAPCIGRVILTHLECIALACLFFFAGFSYRTDHMRADGTRAASLKTTKRIKIKVAALILPFLKSSLLLWAAGTVYLAAAGRESVREALLCLRNYFAGGLWNDSLMSLLHLKSYFVAERYFYMTDLWILPAMLFAGIMFYLIADRALRSFRETMIVSAALLIITAVFAGFGIMLPYNLHMAPYWTVFMLLGAYAGRYRLFDRIKTEDKWVPGIVSLGLGISVAMIRPAPGDLSMGSFGENELLSMLLCVIASVPAIWGMGQLASLAQESGIRLKPLEWLGTNYLSVFVFYRSIAWIISLVTGFSLMYKGDVTGATIAESLLLSMAVLILFMVPSVVPAAFRERSEKKKRRERITAARRGKAAAAEPPESTAGKRGPGGVKDGSSQKTDVNKKVWNQEIMKPLSERRRER